ncbi:transcription-repair coupling factor [Rhodobacteraceae bacterium NNCM2]|nr:transcription-repair coupling factor [Coraliihabitans acroporae]
MEKSSTHAAEIAPGAVTVCGAPDGWDAHYLTTLVDRVAGPVLHVARDDARAAALAEALAVFRPDLPVMHLPAWDCLPYDRVSPNPEIAAARMATLAVLADGFDRPAVVITTLNAATQRVPRPEVVAEESFIAEASQQIDVDALVSWLSGMGFNRVSTVIEHGDFAVRGGIIDIFPPGETHAVRLDFFGDVLESARRFDVETQRTIEKIARVELAPASEIILTEAAITRFRQRYREAFGAARLDDPLYAAVSEGRKHQSMEHWLPLFHEGLGTVFDYLPNAPVTLCDQIDEALSARFETVEDHYSARVEALEMTGRHDVPYRPLPPGSLYLDREAWAGVLSDRAVRAFTPHKQPLGPGVIDAGGRAGRNFSPERQQEGVNIFDKLVEHIRHRAQNGPVVLASYSEGARERLLGLLADHGLTGAKAVTRWQDVDGVCCMVWGLEQGFQSDKLTVISEQDVLGDRLIRRARKGRRAENFLTEAQTLTPGDLVVHLDHGVGRYLGLETVTALGAPHECLNLEYHGGAKLYLPVENIELLSRYGQETGDLDRLGGGAWQAKKAKMKARIRDMADKLIRIAAERELRQGEVVNPGEGFAEFCARFPYQETDDQLNAIEAVMEDLGSGRPMDRLICGDVGFGKTEVALRAAYAAAASGLQVALVAPTTLLARQHAKEFAARFHGTGLRVRQLSRFVSNAEAALTRKGLEDGEIAVVVGTHALLGKAVKFCNLGLLIIDEEQHFGVRHKERLKELRSDVHVLTMTATPIPRTLQLAMSGVRELSVIATPPVDRLAVRTYVSPFDTVTVREALLREHYRGGQSFMVVPRISDLHEAEEFLRDQVPEVTYVVAHGQMAAGELDTRMNNFYDGKYDVLLATTIIESGLDIPTANTLIVNRADMFGLAQLYQIRGRVGRSKLRAYAYFTTPPRKPLTPQAERRLKVLSSLDTLGAGFTLASHDLDIRGAGNLLGEEQSGHIKEVGFELYQEMLEETIAKIRSGEMNAVIEEDDHWAPQINLGVPVLIPEDYITDLDVRLGLYRRLSGLESRQDMEGFAAELHDRFGKPPAEVETLLRVVRVKAMCKRAGIEKLDTGPKGCTVQFRNDKFADPAGLVAFLQEQRGLAKIKDNKLVIRRNWSTDKERVNGAFVIARDLAKIAKAAKKAA